MDDSLAGRAWRELYGTEPRHELVLRYSGKFKGYNAHVVKMVTRIEFSLARAFETMSDEIKLGVLQHLLNRIQKTRVKTIEIELYNKFLKNLTDYALVTKSDPILTASFDRVNTAYFDGYMLTPNLVWGEYTLTKLGHYTFATDTIVLSRALAEDDAVMDYVMYHEMLHKKHKYDETPGGMTRSHTTAFRADERKYTMPDGADAEKRLHAFVREKRRMRVPRASRPRTHSWFSSLKDFF